MKLSHRINLFIAYYIFVFLALVPLVYFDVLKAQSEAVNYWFDQWAGFSSGELRTLEVSIIIALTLVSSVIPAAVLILFKNKVALPILAMLLLLAIGASYIVAQQYAVLLPFVYILIGIGAGLLTGVYLKMIYSSTEKDFLRAAFSQFVSEEKLKELLRDPNKLRLTGNEHDITVMFLDIRGFTSYSEHKSPAIVVHRLNELLEIVTHIIIKNGGMVDKYIGDAVMAIWGAPSADKKQASKACKAALEIKQIIESETDFKIGVGLNYGNAIVGNIGSSKRYDYTAIGDTVNTASRIEGLTKSLGEGIVVSESVIDKLHNEKVQFHFNDLGEVVVKGKNIKLHVYGLLS